MNTNGESYAIWNLPLSNLWNPAPPHASLRWLKAISGIPLCKQELVPHKATVGMGLEVRIYTYTSREGAKRLHAICCKADLSVNIV